MEIGKKVNVRTKSFCSSSSLNRTWAWPILAIFVTCVVAAAINTDGPTTYAVVSCDNVQSIIRIGTTELPTTSINDNNNNNNDQTDVIVLATFSADSCSVGQSLPILEKSASEIVVSYKDFDFGRSVGAFLCIVSNETNVPQHLGLSSVFYPVRYIYSLITATSSSQYFFYIFIYLFTHAPLYWVLLAAPCAIHPINIWMDNEIVWGGYGGGQVGIGRELDSDSCAVVVRVI